MPIQRSCIALLLAASAVHESLQRDLLRPEDRLHQVMVKAFEEHSAAFNESPSPLLQGPEDTGQPAFAPETRDGTGQAPDPGMGSAPEPWWNDLVRQPLGDRPHELIEPSGLIHHALAHAPGILAISQEPLIQETEIEIADAAFDVETFLRTRYDDRFDPVGNLLQTGGEPFLKDHIWTGEGGLRKKLYSGGTVELGQTLGFHNSNNRFFLPQDQGTATLALHYFQPLMRGRGDCYNRSQITIAQIGTGMAWDQYSVDLQAQLSELVEAYWNLSFRRAVLFQKQQNVERGEVVLLKLEGRSSLDSLPSQIARARAAVRARATELAVARRDMLDAETGIRRILGNPDAFSASAPELVPAELPCLTPNPIPMQNAISVAMQERGEIGKALQKAKVAAVQRDISSNELRPELNLIFDTYASALRGESDIPGAWTDQFSDTTPGFAGGLEFSMPWQNRAARARLTQRQQIVAQIQHEIDATVHEVVADAQIAWRRLDTAWQTSLAARAAIDAAHADLQQNEARWEAFALVEGDLADGQTPTTLLDQLLDAQQRLANAEFTWAQSMAEYKIAEINLKRAMGTLMSYAQ